MNGDTLLTCLYFVEASVNYIKIEKREFLRVSSEPSRTTPNVTFLACLSSEVKLLLLILKSYVQMSGIAQFPPVWLAIACKSVDRPVDDAKKTKYPFTSPRQAGSGMETWGRLLRALASRLVMYCHGSTPRRRQVSTTLRVAA